MSFFCKLYKKIFPIIVIFTDDFIPKRFSGYNIGFINFIRPDYSHDDCLIQHEIRHSKQFWNNPIKYILGRWLKYFKFLPRCITKWSERKTFEFECEAYGEQLACIRRKFTSDEQVNKYLEIFASYVVTKYNLTGFTFDEASKLIYRYFKKYYYKPDK